MNTRDNFLTEILVSQGLDIFHFLARMHTCVHAHPHPHTKSGFYHGVKINFKKNSSHGTILMYTTLMSFLQIVWS